MRDVEDQVRDILVRGDEAAQIALSSLLTSIVRPTSARARRFRGEVTRASLKHSVTSSHVSAAFLPHTLDKKATDDVVAHFGTVVATAVTSCLQQGFNVFSELVEAQDDCPFQLELELWIDMPRFSSRPALCVAEQAIETVLRTFAHLPEPCSWFGSQLLVDGDAVVGGQASILQKFSDDAGKGLKFSLLEGLCMSSSACCRFCTFEFLRRILDMLCISTFLGSLNSYFEVDAYRLSMV